MVNSGSASTRTSVCHVGVPAGVTETVYLPGSTGPGTRVARGEAEPADVAGAAAGRLRRIAHGRVEAQVPTGAVHAGAAGSAKRADGFAGGIRDGYAHRAGVFWKEISHQRAKWGIRCEELARSKPELAAVDGAVVRRRDRKEMPSAEHLRGDLRERLGVIQHPDTAAVSAGHERALALLENEVVDRDGRQVRPQRGPVAAAVECGVDPGLRGDDEEIGIGRDAREGGAPRPRQAGAIDRQSGRSRR